MSDSNGLYRIALGGLAAVIAAVGAVWLTWSYALPQVPNIPSYEVPKGPEGGYHAGGAGCDPQRLNRLPPNKVVDERSRCAEAREDHRIRQAELGEAARANGLAEGNLQLAYEQARIAFAQTIATALAFVAAAVAAICAGIAVYHAKRSADADNAALAETREASARQLRPYVFFAEDDDREGNTVLTHKGVATLLAKNFGQMPARGVRIWREAMSVNRPIGDLIVDLSEAKPFDSFDLAPGGTQLITIAMSDLTEEQFNAFTDPDLSLVMVVRLRLEYDWQPGKTDHDDITFVLCAEAVQTNNLPRLGRYQRELQRGG